MVDFTREDIDRIVELYTVKKRSITSIANGWRVSRDTIRNVLRDNGVEILAKPVVSTKAKIIKAFEEGQSGEDTAELAAKYGCTESYVRVIWSDWSKAQKVKNKIEPATVHVTRLDSIAGRLTVDKLKEFSKTVKVGDTFALTEYNSESGDKRVHTKKVVVTVTAIYPHFAMTDKGAKIWFDLYKAKKL